MLKLSQYYLLIVFISSAVGKTTSIVHTLCRQTFCWKIIKLLCYRSCEKVFDEVVMPADYIFGFPFIIFSVGEEGLWDQKLISEEGLCMSQK
jgi:hypothetical protein